MNWIIPLIILIILAYVLIAYRIHSRKLWEKYITFYGPFMALKTDRVGFFDRFLSFSTCFRLYGTLGVVMVILVSGAMVAMLFYSLYFTVATHPPATAVNEIGNVLAIPGVNQFIPFTAAVWLALIVTMVVHEFGHAILCRIEGIRVKSMGILFAVIPVGAFVEPDEGDQEQSKGLSKMRMLGAGITNNILIGLACFVVLLLLLGMAVPLQAPLVKSVYVDYPAAQAGFQPDSLVRSVNGIDVTSRDEISAILNSTRPGDQATLVTEKDGELSKYTLTLSSWPSSMADRTSGFMGVSYYDADGLKQVFTSLVSPSGIFALMAIPIYVILHPVQWGGFLILVNDTTDSLMWSVPFPHFWLVIQILFWCGWFNLAVGTFNALPLIPLDGGYILKAGVDWLLDKKGLIKYSGYVVTTVSYVMLVVIMAIFLLPILLSPGPA
jgi:membrane-associated protease RseP (regulator of RpoE activity)